MARRGRPADWLGGSFLSWILCSSGELSGDQRLEDLIRGIRASGCSLPFRGFSAAAGVEPLYPRNDVSMMGFDRLRSVVGELLAARKALLAAVQQEKPQLALLVDYGGFNLRLGTELKRLGIPVVYYVPPKIWAWGGWRLAKLKAAADLVVPVFGFENQWLQERGVRTLFAGHPAQDRFRKLPTQEEARRSLNLPIGDRILLAMPGSRPGEIERHMPVLARAFRDRDLARRVDRVVIPVARPGLRPLVERFCTREQVAITWVEHADQHVYCSSDCAWIASGTANLEAAWCGVPAAVFYKTGFLTWTLGRRLVKVPWLSPVNLLAGEELYREYLQGACTAGNLIQWLDQLDPARERRRLASLPGFEEPVIPKIVTGISRWLQ